MPELQFLAQNGRIVWAIIQNGGLERLDPRLGERTRENLVTRRNMWR